MYADDFFFREPPGGVMRILRIELHDFPLSLDEVMEVARKGGATSMQSEGECFWLVLPDNLRKVWPFSKNTLQEQISEWNRNGFVPDFL